MITIKLTPAQADLLQQAVASYEPSFAKCTRLIDIIKLGAKMDGLRAVVNQALADQTKP